MDPRPILTTGAKPESGGDVGLKVVEILEAASESLKREGAKVDLSEIARKRSTPNRESIQLKTAQAV